MNKTLCLLVLLSITTVCLASYVDDWKQLRSLSDVEMSTERIVFHVALKQRNINLLEEVLYSVSDPESESYGKHVTKEFIAELTAPPKEVVRGVASFLLGQSQNKKGDDVIISNYDDAIKVDVTIAYATALFQSEFNRYVHGPTQRTAIRAKQIKVPAGLTSDVDMITGLVGFPIIPAKLKTTEEAVHAAHHPIYHFISTTHIRKLYNIPESATVKHHASQCAVEFLPEGGFSSADLQKFCALSEVPFKNFTMIGANKGEGIESQLDVEMLVSMGRNADNYFWSIKNGWIYEMALDFIHSSKRPQVFSISYAWPEVLTCEGTATNAKCNHSDYTTYIKRTNVELMKLGALGLTVLSASGDDGAPSNANLACYNTTHPIFPLFPASSPYITSVSGTSIGPDTNSTTTHTPKICKEPHICTTASHEAACEITNTHYGWTTGGGFSELTARPSYQDDAVLTYLKNASAVPPPKWFWPANRGYPDISAVGARVAVVLDGSVTFAEGTSASCPIVASIVALLNDERNAANKPALGFLNPLLYKMAAAKPAAFRDITEGSNAATQDQYCPYGYTATTGWDAVTGLGTPNYLEMLAYIKALKN